MTSRKPRRRNQQQIQPSDYESDTISYNYLSDSKPPAEFVMASPPQRSNEELNLAVLRRHNPAITSILSLAPYAVVYLFSPTTRQWEKNGVEGSMFVCALTQGSQGEERYCVFVLNRRGLNNFDTQLTEGDNVEVTEEYVILKVDKTNEYDHTTASAAATDGDVQIYGLWIYSEPPPNSTAETRTLNAQVIRECAVHAGESRKLARERLEALRQNGLHVAAAAASTAPTDEVAAEQAVPMGRQISLKDLFGQQRAQDDEWSVKAHHIQPQQHQHHQHQQYQQPYQQPQPQPQFQGDVLGDLFRKAGLAYQERL
ncbi:hypothetical protein ASPZODRAFT_150530 [Penicilliopsis zonata CBS 506.65]|uniref:PH domain-like protein n=1 Tax=Penicilliopsis zonata CBS 506.65 TaxID=1073090 RepID=A0A1L9SM40_9EURO|nr:hypothetical protein ASPZODRAFT_150530 [Penicilliopsis zonata CBS 506.65]OJJ48258.1 hypothetical protein ASPZODRAFT_150530 [Penicilliopsis zonata CBS 506.65]